jgi:transglutaminase-like putative cysteine protease
MLIRASTAQFVTAPAPGLITLLWLLLAALFTCSPARARDTGTDPAVVVDRYIQHYVVEPDGSYRLSVDQAKTIVQQRALRVHGQYAISYNRTLDELLSLEAWTQKPDGRRVPVQPGQVQDQQEAAAASGEAPMFQDTRLKVVVFPEAAVGDQLVVRYVVRRKTALFPGHFEDLSSSPFYPNKHFLLIYDMPASMPLRADAVGFVPVPGDSPPGRRRYQWRYVDGDNERLEAGSVSYLDYGKRLAVSTFPDYAAFARAFRLGAAAAARPSPAASTPSPIAALARQLTAGLPDARARALALSDWVRHNIRYVGVYVGPGGVVPHPPATVLENRYGDCKDHAGLLEALLAAAGIDSTGALVNSGNAYRLPEAPTLGVFNHMITYVPGLDLYLDPTAEFVGAGYLPSSILGKPVLLLKTGSFAMTPIVQPERNRSTAWFDIGREGRSSFRLARTASGAMAEPYRTALRDSRQTEREQFVQRMLQGLGRKSRGVFDALPDNGNGDGDGDGGKAGGNAGSEANAGLAGDEVRWSFSGTSDGFLDLPGPSAVATTYDFWGGLAEAVFNLGQESERHQDFVCPAVDHEDETGFRFPKGVRILAMPRQVSLMDGGIFYRASYERRGNEVRVKRRLTFRHGRATCTPADYRAMQPALERIIRDLRSQIVVAGN